MLLRKYGKEKNGSNYNASQTLRVKSKIFKLVQSCNVNYLKTNIYYLACFGIIPFALNSILD